MNPHASGRRHDRSARWSPRLRAGVLVTALLASTLATFAGTSTPASAAVPAAGPAATSGEAIGLPTYMQDATGLQLQPCIHPTLCITPPGAFADTGELFYNLANATMGDLTLELALEGTEDGGRNLFQRIRVNKPAGANAGTYTLTHPWGVDVFTTAGGKFRDTVDTGCVVGLAGLPGCGGADFSTAVLPPEHQFVRWDKTGTQPPTGFIGGGPGLTHTIEPGANGVAYFRLEGPVGQLATDFPCPVPSPTCAQQDTWDVQGMLIDGPTTPDLAALSDTGAAPDDNITNDTTPTFDGIVYGAADTSTVTIHVSTPAGTPVASSLPTLVTAAGGTATYAVTIPLLAPGTYNVTAGSMAGGVGPESVNATPLSVTIDTAAPTPPPVVTGFAAPAVLVTSNPPLWTGSSMAPGIRGTTGETAGTVQVFDAGVDAGCASALAGSGGTVAGFTSATGVPAAATANAARALRVRVLDLAGNASACSNPSVTYLNDSLAPAAPSITAGPGAGATVANTGASLTFTAADLTATFQCALDAGAFAPCTSPRSLTGLGQGAHTFAVRSADVLLNTSAATTRTWTVDTVGPTTTFVQQGNILSATPAFSFSSSEAGSTFVCALDGAAAAACASGLALAALPAGSAHSLVVSATDGVGNTGPNAVYNFTVAGAAPIVNPPVVTPPVNNPPVNTPPVTIPPVVTPPAVTPPVVTPPVVTPPSSPGTLDTRPFVLARTPTFEQNSVGQRTSVRVFFNEAVSSVNAATFQVRSGGILSSGTPVVARAISYDPVTNSATFTPLTPLAPGTRYTAIVRSGIVDAAGQPLIASAWSFITAPRPSVVQRTPAAGSTKVNRGTNVVARFSEAVSGVSASRYVLRNSATGALMPAVVTYNPVTKIATLKPVGTLRGNTSYTARLIAGIRDVDGNSFSGTSWTFRTAP